MPRFDLRCPSCGDIERDRVLPGGVHPPCRHCGAVTEYYWQTATPHGIQTDEAFIGGQVIENLGHDPVTIYSRQHLQREMEKRGLEQRIKWVPGDKHLQNWGAYIDPYTMANAKELLERAGQRKPESDPGHLETLKTEIRAVRATD